MQTEESYVKEIENYRKESDKETTEQQDKESSMNKINSQINNLKNCREKTPMCLVNDLARYNKVKRLK